MQNNWVHFKLSPVGGDTNRGSPPWAVGPPPTNSTATRQFEMHPSHWYVVYTKPCCERKVSVLLNKKRIENYFPLNYKRSQSLMQNRIIEEPLFESYVFVNTTEINIVTISKQIKNIVSLLYWIREPAIIYEDEIIAIKEFTNNHHEIRLEKLHVNLKIYENIMDGISYIMDGKNFMAKNRAIKLNLPSLGFTIVAGTEDENIMSKGIMPSKRESLVQS